jgi:carbonic anhydrase
MRRWLFFPGIFSEGHLSGRNSSIVGYGAMGLKKGLLLMLIVALAAPAAMAAEMRPLRKVRPGVPPHEVIENVTRANTRMLLDLPPEKVREAGGPPVLTWLTDCEADIRSEFVTAFPGQKAFTVRNLGFQLASSAAAIDYAIHRLYTPVLLITGNTGNEAIRLFMEGSQELEPEIHRELNYLHLALAQAGPAAEAPERFKEQWLSNVERNVDYQVQEAVARYRERVADGRLVVVGSILDLENAYGRGEGRLLIININGETDETRLRQSPHIVRVEPETRAAVIGRKKKALSRQR